MDGFQELERPTLLVALTNRIDLLDTALLRPGRFEVQVREGCGCGCARDSGCWLVRTRRVGEPPGVWVNCVSIRVRCELPSFCVRAVSVRYVVRQSMRLRLLHYSPTETPQRLEKVVET